MALTNPPAAPAAPGTAPSRSDEATFDARAEAAWTWLFTPFWTFIAAFRAWYADVAKPELDALVLDVTTKSQNADAAAAAAAATAGATKWISGTNYAEGYVVWSPSDFKAYRRKSAGAGATDPSVDGANWAAIGASGGGAATATLAAGEQRVLTSSSAVVQSVNATGLGATIKFADATALSPGPDKVVVVNTGEKPVGILNGANQVLGQVLGGDTARFTLTDASAAAGVWEGDDALDPWFLTAEAAGDFKTNTPYLIALNANASLVHYQNATGYPCIRYLAHAAADSSLAFGAEYVLDTVSASVESTGVLLGATRIVLKVGAKFVLVDYSAGPTLTCGTPVAHTIPALPMPTGVKSFGDDRYFLAMGGTTIGGNNFRAVCFDCGAAGTTLTAGVAVEQAPTVGADGVPSSLSASHVVSATKIAFTGAHASNGYATQTAWARTITRGAGTVITWGANAAPTSPRTDTSNLAYTVQQIAAATYLCKYLGDGGLTRLAVLTMADPPTFAAPATSATMTSENTYIERAGESVWVLYGPSSLGKMDHIAVAGTAVTLTPSAAVDAAFSGGTAMTVSLVSRYDGKGVAFYQISGGTRYCGFVVGAGAITFGTSKIKLPDGASGPQATLADGATPRRFWSLYSTVSSINTGWLRELSIDAAGNIALTRPNRWTFEAYPAFASAQATGGRALYSAATGGIAYHGVALANGRFRLGRGAPASPSAGYFSTATNRIQGDTAMLCATPNSDGSAGTTGLISRWRFAEV